MEQTSLTIGIFLFPDVEVLDFAGPFEVFSVASRVAQRRGLAHKPFDVITISATGSTVVARHGLQIIPSHSFGNAPPIDILIVPGGIVLEPLSNKGALDWLRTVADGAALTASVCTGAFILAQIGLLDGLKATTHWEDVDEMRAMFPNVVVTDDAPYVDQGAVVTSAGISAGIGMSLHLIERMMGRDLAVLTAQQMQYDWCPADA